VKQKSETKLGLERARANGRLVVAVTSFRTQQAEAIKMIRLGAKSQAEIAELFNVDRSTIFPNDERGQGEEISEDCGVDREARHGSRFVESRNLPIESPPERDLNRPLQ
jgi:hypothetical protein